MNPLLKKLIITCCAGAFVITAGACSTGSKPKETKLPEQSQEVPSQKETQDSEPAAKATQAPESESVKEPEQETYADMPLKEAASDAVSDQFEAELYNYKVIRNVPTAYTLESWDYYCSAANILTTFDPENLTDVQNGLI